MAFDSDGNYILFSTGSSYPSRTWSRAETSGTDTTGPLVHAKLKYYVLKNPPNTAKATTKSCLSSAFTIKVNRREYAIDPAIFDALQASIAASPVKSVEQLKERITQIRAATNKPPPINIQLQNVPLSQYKKRYTYLATDSKAPVLEERIAYDFAYRMGIFVGDSPSLQAAIAILKAQFPTAYFGAPQFFYVTPNVQCYSNLRVRDLYPGGAADLFGIPLLSTGNLEASKKNVVFPYFPMYIHISPESDRADGGVFPSQIGLLLGYDSRLAVPIDPRFPFLPELAELMKTNSELVFIPILSRLEEVTYQSYPPSMGVHLLKASDSAETFNTYVNASRKGLSNNKTIAFSAQTYQVTDLFQQIYRDEASILAYLNTVSGGTSVAEITNTIGSILPFSTTVTSTVASLAPKIKKIKNLF